MPIESPVNIFEEIPLPFDDEIEDMERERMASVEEDAAEIYNRHQEWLKENPDWHKMKKVV